MVDIFAKMDFNAEIQCNINTFLIFQGRYVLVYE